jgi:diguanylate cyclase (GGDEF)-like protein
MPRARLIDRKGAGAGGARTLPSVAADEMTIGHSSNLEEGETYSALGAMSQRRARELDFGYRRLAAVVRDLVAEQSFENLLPQIASTLRDLVHCEDVVIWEVEGDRHLVASFVSGEDADQIQSLRIELGQGITGKAALWCCALVANDAHLDPRAGLVPGTEPEPEAIACMPLIARGALMGALSLYRSGDSRAFHREEIELAQAFADVAALVLDNVRTRTELRELATTDDLTKLANRRRFDAELERQLAEARRTHSPLSLLMFDLDNFKRINDTYGHQAGDQLLRLVSSTVRRCVRTTDLAARIGGDEFAVLQPHTGRRDAEALARRLQRAIADLPSPIATTISTGVAALENDGQKDLIAEADRLLYQAKRAKR